MRLLVLGGTSFVGRHLVLAARAAGIEVTLFNRGRTNPGLFSDLEQIHGDRDGGLDGLLPMRWDAVLDVNGYVPRIVEQSAQALAEVAHYTFISSISVYDDLPEGGDETTAVAKLAEPTEEVTGDTYGALKALCEQAVTSAFGDRALIVRPGLVVGPHDPTERAVRWVRRTADGGRFIAPGEPDRPVQFIDARDLADWVIRMVVGAGTGTFNATGPHPPVTMGEVVDTCCTVTGADPEPVWVSDDFLLEHDVTPWLDLPLWLPTAMNSLFTADISRARGAGLTFRPLEDTLRATWAWDRARSERGQAGMSVGRELEVLAAWDARS